MRHERRLALAGLCLALLACGGDEGTMFEPTGDPVGIYTLQTINGESLPFVWFEFEGTKVEFLSGTVTLREDHSFTDATTFRVTEAGEVSEEEDVFEGTWARGGATITFSTGGDSYAMTFNGENRLTQVFETLTLVYIK